MEIRFRPQESQLSEIASQPAPIPSIWLSAALRLCNRMRAIARACAKALSRQSAEIL